MASAILSIEGGGQPPVEDNPAVIFADYDGTVIDTWTWDNKGSKTELPTVPAHEGLVFEGWNWTLEDIKNDTTGQIITVGPYYHTESGLTEIDIEVNETNGMELQFSVMASNYTSLDWGDGTSIENIGHPSHIYEVPGKYTIKISGYSGQNNLYHCNYQNNNFYEVRSYIIKAIRFNSGVNAVGCRGKGIRYITIPKTMIKIELFENLGCIQLTVPENARSNNSRFNGKKLKYIAMPKNYFNFSGQPGEIANSVFYDCSSLQSIYIPESITSIDTYAFGGCSSLQSIYIPENVTSIRDNTFRDCSSLQSISIPNSVTSLGNYFFSGCSSLQSINIPSGVTNIGSRTFQNCSSLQSINIPNSITSIGTYAFSDCFSINKAIISSSAAIGSYVYSFQNYTTFDFSGCSSIPVLSSSNGIGGKVEYVKVIYVPITLYDEWIKATNWVVFKDKIKPKGLDTFIGKDKLLYNESVTLTATYVGDKEPTDITVTASNPDAIEIGQYTIDAINKTITIPATSKNVTDTVIITLNASFNGNINTKTFSIRIKESYPSYEVLKVDGAPHGFFLNDNGYYESEPHNGAFGTYNTSLAYCKVNCNNLGGMSKIIFDTIYEASSASNVSAGISNINVELPIFPGVGQSSCCKRWQVDHRVEESVEVNISDLNECYFTIVAAGENNTLQFKVRFE